MTQQANCGIMVISFENLARFPCSPNRWLWAALTSACRSTPLKLTVMFGKSLAPENLDNVSLDWCYAQDLSKASLLVPVRLNTSPRHVSKLIQSVKVCHLLDCSRKAADQGHAHASYNYAIGHLKGYKSDLRKGWVLALQHRGRNIRGLPLIWVKHAEERSPKGNKCKIFWVIVGISLTKSLILITLQLSKGNRISLNEATLDSRFWMQENNEIIVMVFVDCWSDMCISSAEKRIPDLNNSVWDYIF